MKSSWRKRHLSLGLVQRAHEDRTMEDGFKGQPAFLFVGRVELSGPGNIFLPFGLRVLPDFFFHQEVGASKDVTE